VQRILQPGEIEALDRTRMPRLRMPEPESLYIERAARLRQQAEGGHPIADYLRFAARLVDAQRDAARQLATRGADEVLDADLIARSQEHSMPLLPAAEHIPAAWQDALTLILQALQGAAETPPMLRAEIERLQQLSPKARDALAQQALGRTLAAQDVVLGPLLMAALQVVFMARASRIPEADVPYVEPATVCPVCASQPVAGVLRIGGAVSGLRFMHCGTCATEWHTVRVKCSHCGSTEGVRYQSLEGSNGAILAETCSSCGTYRKLADQEKDPLAEPLADDLASLMLDLLMGETEFVRSSTNPLLLLAPPSA
jgi:FdhE protein